MPILRPVLSGIAAFLVLSGPLLGYEAAVHRANDAPKPRHVYRLDYTLTVSEPGKPPAISSYVLNVEEGDRGDLNIGANVPLGSGSSPGQMSFPRQDVGLHLHTNLDRAGGDLVLHGGLEMSGVDDRAEPGPWAIHKIVTSGDAVVTPGKSALVATVEDPARHARYDLTVAATKLR